LERKISNVIQQNRGDQATMKQLTVISGKGGTGKTSITASLAVIAKNVVVADCDVMHRICICFCIRKLWKNSRLKARNLQLSTPQSALNAGYAANHAGSTPYLTN
jgi:Mrp family chromosome partitioning ATPase